MMKYYKVIFNDRVIDILSQLIYLKYQEKHDMMILCDESEAQAVMSSGQDMIWHVKGWYNIPVDGYDTVEVVEVDEYEFRQLKALNYKTPEEIVDNFVLELVSEGIL